MVAIRELRFTSRDGSVHAMMPWVSPPVPMLMSNCGALMFVFTEMPGHMSHKQYLKMWHAVRAEAQDSLKLRCLDGCASNDRMITKEVRESRCDSCGGRGSLCCS